MLINLVFQHSNKSFSKNRYFFIVCWINFNVIYSQKSFVKIIVKFTPLSNPYFIWFASFGLYFATFWDFFWDALTIKPLHLSFKGTTHSYLLKISIAHNKDLIPLLHLLSDFISAKSRPLKFSDDLFTKFIFKLVIWHRIDNTSTKFFAKKTCRPLKLILFDSHLNLYCLQFQTFYLSKFCLIEFFLLNLLIHHKPHHAENKLYQDHFSR